MKKFVLTVFIFSFIILNGCGDNNQKNNNDVSYTDAPNYGDTYVEASIAEPVTLNPLLYTDNASGDIISYIFDGLLKYDTENRIVPDLADTFEIVEDKSFVFLHIEESEKKNLNQIKSSIEQEKSNFPSFKDIYIFRGADNSKSIIGIDFSEDVSEDVFVKFKEFNKAINFINYRYIVNIKLKENLKWSDGKSLTSADVLFTYNKIIDPKTCSPRRTKYNMIKSVTTPDRYSVSVEYFKPFAPALESWMMNIIPKHILEHEDMIETKFNRFPTGTGKYKLVQWSPDEYIILEGNDNYYSGKPYIEKVMVKNIPDKSQQFLDLKNGLIDFMSMTPDQYKKQVNTAEFKSRFNIYNIPSSTYYSFVGYNCSRKPFDSINLRQALSYAINVDEIIENVFYGMGTRVTGPFPIISWAYNKNAKKYDYNMEKAKTLLEEDGWVDSDGDGIREKDGKKLEIELITNNGNKEREYMIMLIKDYWQKVGIQCNTRLEEWGNFLHLQDVGDFDAVLLGWGLALDPDIYNIWHSDNIPNEDHPTSFNFARYNNKTVDELLERARFTFDTEKRKEYYNKIHEIIANEQPYTFLIAEDSLSVIDKRFKGIKQKGNSIFYNFNEWYVPAELVKYK